MQNPTKQSVIDKFDDIVKKINEQKRIIVKMSKHTDNEEDQTKLLSLKEFLAFLIDDIKDLKKDTKKVSRKPRKISSEPSGIFKPVKISDELAKFTGWEIDSLHSRVEVYSFVYNYVKENGLNQTTDKKDIIEPDIKLKKLLGYDEDKDGPLKFFSIQEFLKRENHFE